MASTPNTISGSTPSSGDDIESSSERPDILAAIMGLTSLGGAPVSPNPSNSFSRPNMRGEVSHSIVDAPPALNVGLSLPSHYLGHSPQSVYDNQINEIKLPLETLKKLAAEKPIVKMACGKTSRLVSASIGRFHPSTRPDADAARNPSPRFSTTTSASVEPGPSAFKTKLSSWAYSFDRTLPADSGALGTLFRPGCIPPSSEYAGARTVEAKEIAASSPVPKSLAHLSEWTSVGPLPLPSRASRPKPRPCDPYETGPKIMSKTFPETLLAVVSAEEYSDIISWLPHGRGFAILDKRRFVNEILPRHFDRAKFTSFARRLKRWNFERVPSGPELGAYYNKYFLRDHPELMQRVVYHNNRLENGKEKKEKVKSEGRAKKCSSNKDQSEPDNEPRALPSQEEYEQTPQRIPPAKIQLKKRLSYKNQAQLNDESHGPPSQEEHRQLQQRVLSASVKDQSHLNDKSHRLPSQEEFQRLQQPILHASVEVQKDSSNKDQSRPNDESHRLPSQEEYQQLQLHQRIMSAQEEYKQLQQRILSVNIPNLDPKILYSKNPHPRDEDMHFPSTLSKTTKHVFAAKKRAKHTVGTLAKKNAEDAAILRENNMNDITNHIRDRTIRKIEMKLARSMLSRQLSGRVASQPTSTAASRIQPVANRVMNGPSWNSIAYKMFQSESSTQILESMHSPGYRHRSSAMYCSSNNPNDEIRSSNIPNSFGTGKYTAETNYYGLESGFSPYFAQSLQGPPQRKSHFPRSA